MFEQAGIAVAVAAFVLANLPFLSDRLFLVVRRDGGKGFGLRLAELVVLYLALGAASRAIEASAHGSAYPQNWEFYAITGCIFVVFAYPGFVYRYFWRDRKTQAG